MNRIVFCIALCCGLLANEVVWSQRGGFAEFEMDQLGLRQQTVPSIGGQDSLFVEVWSGQKYLSHKIQPGQTLYSIKKFYAVDLSDLYYSNPNLEANGLAVGQRLRIPLVSQALRRYRGANFIEQAYLPVYYRVRPSETLYRIARIYFRLPVDVLRNRNQLYSDQVYKNEVLLVGWISRMGIPDSLKTISGLPGMLGEVSQKNKHRYEVDFNGQNEKVLQGTACWDKAMDLADKNKLYVLCSYVPKGHVVRLENPMTGRELYAKVVAPKPENSFTQSTIVLVTPTVAKALGGLDARFYVKLYYCN
jgi:LysM repeat protein